MPIKSEAQRKRLQQLVKDGKMTQAQYDQYEADTPKSKLPEKVAQTNKGHIRSVRKVIK